MRYRTTALLDLLSGAAISPDTPFCADPAADPTDCRRVAPTTFVMPQNGDTRAAIFTARAGLDFVSAGRAPHTEFPVDQPCSGPVGVGVGRRRRDRFHWCT